jgi:hypothetical protein
MKTAPREYGAIKTERGGWTPYDAVAVHAREKAILLDELVCTHGPTVVVTHHPPLAACADAYSRGGWLATACPDAKRLKALEDENAKLKKLLAEAMLDNKMLKDVASKKW